MAASPRPPRVFVSYTQEDNDHKERVLGLVDRLRSQFGIDVQLDQTAGIPQESWPMWMARQIRDSDFIIMICTKTYYERAMGDHARATGGRWEGRLIINEFYEQGGTSLKYLPLVFSRADLQYIPTPFRGMNHYTLTSDAEEQYHPLIRHLHGEPEIAPAPLNPVRFVVPPSGARRGGPVQLAGSALIKQIVPLLHSTTYQEAEQRLLECVQRDGCEPAVHYLLALAHLCGRTFARVESKERLKAEQQLRQAHVLDPQFLPALVGLAALELDYYQRHGMAGKVPNVVQTATARLRAGGLSENDTMLLDKLPLATKSKQALGALAEEESVR